MQPKVVFVGGESSGKTCLIRALKGIKYNKNYVPTPSVDQTTKKIFFSDGNSTIITLAEIGGTPLGVSLIPTFARCAKVAVITVPVNVHVHESDIVPYYEALTKLDIKKILVVCTKFDDKSDKYFDKAKSIAKSKGLKVIRVSSKNNTNVYEKLLQTIGEYIYEYEISLQTLSKKLKIGNFRPMIKENKEHSKKKDEEENPPEYVVTVDPKETVQDIAKRIGKEIHM